MTRIGPRMMSFTDRNGADVDVEVWFVLDGEARDPDEPDLKTCFAIISRGDEEDVVRAYANDQLQACHRLMMLSSAYLAQMADAEGLYPKLGGLPGDAEGFALFRY